MEIRDRRRSGKPRGRGVKIIIVAHGHPTLHKGGGEVAAYSLHKMLRAHGHQSVFVGWGGQSQSANGGSLTQIGEDDYLLFTESEHFRFSSMSKNLPEAFAVLLDAYKPDTVHFHHYVHVGIEAAALVKKLLPQTKVMLTFHEYLAICANNGQLFTKTNEICTGYAPERCSAKCFPHIKPATFFMREIAVKSALSFVDEFIAPSKFLADQYVSWGIPTSRIWIIENPLMGTSLTTRRSNNDNQNYIKELNIGFFGQINFYKGLDIIVRAVLAANESGRSVRLGIHGNYSDVTGGDYIDDLRSTIESAPDVVNYHGAYSQTDVHSMMSRYHFVIMGSRWYENSPVVMQEAINAGVPLIVPAQGGMVEKVVGAGVSYRPGSADDLASLLINLSADSYKEILQSVRALTDSSATRNEKSFKQIIRAYTSDKKNVFNV